MKITEYGAVRTAEDIKRRRKTGASSSATSFADILSGASTADETPETEAPSDVGVAADISNMLALQEISEEDVHRKKLVQRGKNLLDMLEKLRYQFLMGAVPSHTLEELTRQLSIQKQAVNDPRLLALIDDIELRAAVELAKLEKAAEGL